MIVYLKPRSPFFKELPRSDTLFGAICWGIRWVFGEKDLEGLLERFAMNDPPFILSSAFPYREQNGQRLHLLPRPILKPEFAPPDTLEKVEELKRIKKISYLHQSVFNDLINGRKKHIDLLGSNPKQFNSYETPGNAINRLTGAVDEGMLFFNSEVEVREGGLFFLVRCDQGMATYIQGAIRFLGDRGIGGNSSVGRGFFEPEFSEDQIIEEPEQGDRCVGLSLVHPSEEDLKILTAHQDWLSYELVKRKGHIESMFLNTSRVWKETLLMFKEGSVFPAYEGQVIRGCAPVVHRGVFPVRHNGCAFAVRMAR